MDAESGRDAEPSGTELITELIDRADEARSIGRTSTAARLYDDVIRQCRSTSDLQNWTRAAVGAARLQVFGTDPGRLPADLYDLLVRITEDRDRARVAAALARCWSYAGEPGRAVRFGTEALERAERAGDQEVLADCLDAALSSRWGPDDLTERIGLARRLDEVAAHRSDLDVRLQAHLWGLQVAAETLNLPALNRHLRVIELLGSDSARARFFAASRRCMLLLMHGEVGAVPTLIDSAADAGRRAGLADARLVVESMKGYAAVQRADTAGIASLAEQCEAFATTEGVAAVCAESAYLWSEAGDARGTGRMLDTFTPAVLDSLPRDMNLLLTLQCVLQAALTTDRTELIEVAAAALAGYSDRAVINSGAVMFHGVTDDPLGRAAGRLGDSERAAILIDRAVSTYRRIGAPWWRHRLLAADDHLPRSDRPEPMIFRPAADGLWSIGPSSDPTAVRALRGFGYLRRLLRNPGVGLPALELITDGRPTVLQSDLGPDLDRTALAAFRARLAELQTERDEAEAWADLGRIEGLDAERDALITTIGAATGLSGRHRPVGSSAERARVAATKAISAAMTRIEAVHAPLGRHLRQSIHTGNECCYRPVGDLWTWVLD